VIFNALFFSPFHRATQNDAADRYSCSQLDSSLNRTQNRGVNELLPVEYLKQRLTPDNWTDFEQLFSVHGIQD
jgi:hypothetical protein